MKKGIFHIVILWAFVAGGTLPLVAQPVTDSNWVKEVCTVMLNKNGVELEPPVLPLTDPWAPSGNGDDRLLLRFDVLGPEVENYRYQIRHCDRDWNLDDMEPYDFMNGFDEGPIENSGSSFTTTVPYVHYYQYLPGENSRLLLSGNYVVFVYPQGFPDSILLSRRFCVTEESVKVLPEETVPYDNASIRQRRELDVTVGENPEYRSTTLLPPTLNPQYMHVVVQQNGRLDLRRQLPFTGYEQGQLCYRNRPENIFFGGNTFRWFDISNIRTAMYNVCQIRDFGGEWYALLCPLENRSRKPFITETVLNGGMKVNVWDRNDKQHEADYVYVNFALPMEHPYLDGNIHVVGDLTQWRLDEHSRMEYNMEMKAYTLRLLLKQGYYAYQLLFVPSVGQADSHPDSGFKSPESLTARLEGDHYETRNTYYVHVYYHGPADRYDRLVGYVRVTP